MSPIPLLPRRDLIADLSLRDEPDEMLRVALRGRIYFWTTPGRALSRGWVHVYKNRWAHSSLACRWWAAPVLWAWCLVWTIDPWLLHRLLMAVGFLKRDATLPDWESGYYKNMKWQWRFWRGPYYDVCVARGIDPPGWGFAWQQWRHWLRSMRAWRP